MSIRYQRNKAKYIVFGHLKALALIPPLTTFSDCTTYYFDVFDSIDESLESNERYFDVLELKFFSLSLKFPFFTSICDCRSPFFSILNYSSLFTLNSFGTFGQQSGKIATTRFFVCHKIFPFSLTEFV